MAHTRNILSVLFAAICLIAAVIYVLGEFFDMDIAWFYGVSDSVDFIVQTVAILLSLALVPLALRLFKFQRVVSDLQSRRSEALLFWGTVRLLMLGAVLVVNTLLYYMFGHEPAFGYLAVIAVLVLPFVVPTMNRCLNETTPQVTDSQE